MANNIFAGLYSHLTGDATLAALVSTRVYPGIAPDSAVFPYVVMTQAGYSGNHHLRGATTLISNLVQIDTYAATSVSAFAVRDAIKARINGAYDTTFGSVKVRACTKEAETVVMESPDDGSDTGEWRLVETYRITYEEA